MECPEKRTYMYISKRYCSVIGSKFGVQDLRFRFKVLDLGLRVCGLVKVRLEGLVLKQTFCFDAAGWTASEGFRLTSKRTFMSSSGGALRVSCGLDCWFVFLIGSGAWVSCLRWWVLGRRAHVCHGGCQWRQSG